MGAAHCVAEKLKKIIAEKDRWMEDIKYDNRMLKEEVEQMRKKVETALKRESQSQRVILNKDEEIDSLKKRIHEMEKEKDETYLIERHRSWEKTQAIKERNRETRELSEENQFLRATTPGAKTLLQQLEEMGEIEECDFMNDDDPEDEEEENEKQDNEENDDDEEDDEEKEVEENNIHYMNDDDPEDEENEKQDDEENDDDEEHDEKQPEEKDGNKIACPFCGKTYKRQGITMHKKTCTHNPSVKEERCKDCGKVCRNEVGLRLHRGRCNKSKKKT